jgi:NAD(P)-dependent dehydrogenase (short-subunit alcohol dehydrogenase family)
MSKLTGKVAVVTGGSKGIGAEIARRLAADGAFVESTRRSTISHLTSWRRITSPAASEAGPIPRDSSQR